ncbi:hypothetical protein QZH41_019188 [Actinostola sp. cb2023]|nr:hypothetical protein QZH41_019188 [Actinostola sp. cb2023]
MSMIRRTERHIDGFVWKCNKCHKKRSLRCNSIFALFPKISMGDLLLLMYFWSEDNPRKRTARALGLSKNVVTKFFRTLEDVCTNEIERYDPFIPFGGPGCVVQCDESKFNHKRKVSTFLGV